MPLPTRDNRQFQTDQNGVITDDATRWGIIILGCFLILLIIFFFWYNNRSLDGTQSDGQKQASGSLLERLFNTEPEAAPVVSLPDADADGLDDVAEAKAGTDAAKPDTDGDGLTDREEVLVYKTNPRQADSDGDGMNDAAEIRSRRDPLDKDPGAAWPPAPAPGSLR